MKTIWQHPSDWMASYFNRPGPRVVRGVEVLAHVLHGVTAGDPVRDHEAHRLI